MDKILENFIKESEREFYIRELAKITNKSPTTISKHLNRLKKENILISEKKYNHILFRANVEKPSFKDLKLFYNIKLLRESGLIDHLVKEFNYPESIILFGSYRKAENTKKSDVDLLIITPIKKQLDLDKFENILKTKIQIFSYSSKEIQDMMIKKKELLNNLINGIVLYGFWELFK